MSKTMSNRFACALTLAVVFTCALAFIPGRGAAQEQKQQPVTPPKSQPDQGMAARIASEEVLLDIVARDKKGRPVADLKVDEIEVYEDGVKQQINSFRKVEKNEAVMSA